MVSLYADGENPRPYSNDSTFTRFTLAVIEVHRGEIPFTLSINTSHLDPKSFALQAIGAQGGSHLISYTWTSSRLPTPGWIACVVGERAKQ